MKRIYSIAFVAGVIFSAASCQKEIANEPLQNGGDFTITATTVADTKTVLDDANKHIYWAPGDKISVFDASNKEVSFSTDIDANATSAKFTNDAEFTVPASLVAAYPYRGAYSFDGTTVQNFRIAGEQSTVAGSFDPAYAGAIGLPVSEGSNQLQFTNLHCLIKFTIGGEKAPTKVKLACNGMRRIAGLYNYNLSTGEITQGDGSKEITMTGTFEVGQTYYFSVIPGIVGNGLSLYFDDVVVKNTGVTKTLEPNVIYNMGTFEMPEVVEEPVVSAVEVTRVWGHYGEAGVAWSNEFYADLNGNDRSLAMDDTYIYIAQTTGSFVDANWNGILDEGEKTFDKAYIHKFNISDGSYAGALPVNSDMNLGTHFVSCVRTVKKADGSYVLLVCNLSQSQGLRIFAYVNGTDAEPVTMTTISSGRRWGDKFTVTGTWEDGKMWFRSFDSRGMVGYVPLNGTNTTWSWVEAHAVDNGSAFDAENISEVSWVPGTTGFCILNTNSDLGAHVMSGNASGAYSEVKTYPTLAKTFGYNFFEVGDNKFVAWASLKNGNALPRLQIVQSDATTLDKMVETFNNLETRLIYEAPLQNANDMNTAGVGGGHTVCDCCVREINGEIYIAAMAQKAGLSLFKVTAK